MNVSARLLASRDGGDGGEKCLVQHRAVGVPKVYAPTVIAKGFSIENSFTYETPTATVFAAPLRDCSVGVSQ